MKTVLKLAGRWATYFAALVISRDLAGLRLPTIPPLDHSSAGMRMLLALAAGAVLVAGLYPIAHGRGWGR